MAVLKELLRPQNANKVRQFLGIANYYRRFVGKFSDKPMNHLRILLKHN